MEKSTSSRNVIYITQSAHNTTDVINYDTTNSQLNDFLGAFDVWDSRGQYADCHNPEYMKILFECDKEFLEFSRTELFKKVLCRLGVEATYDVDVVLKLEG